VRVIQIRALRSNGGRDIATFDVAITEHLRLFDLTLRKSEDGGYRTYAPKAAGKHAASFHPDLANQLSAAALAALAGGSSHGRV
jgi:hypothetical protein